MKKTNNFNPLLFLAALGAGGISVIPFAFFQYTTQHPKGLVTFAQMGHGTLPLGKELLYYGLEGVMIVFALLHIGLSVQLFRKLWGWVRSSAYGEYMKNPLGNAGILAPFISLGMTFNVFIAVARFFIPALSANFQALMLPALIAWLVLWAALMRMEVRMLKTSFENTFDISQINFGWLLHPFALAMISVTGTGLAAMAKSAPIAHTAAFFSLVSLTMGIFLFTVKLNSLFKSHFSATGLPEKQFLPSLLIVVPNITLFAISGFRLSHYLENHMGMHAHNLGVGIILVAYAFEVWYLLFGLTMLRTYFKKHFVKSEFYPSLWGLICPFVAFAVLGSFFYKLFVPNPIVIAVILITTVFTISLYMITLARQISCARATRKDPSVNCANGFAPLKAAAPAKS